MFLATISAFCAVGLSHVQPTAYLNRVNFKQIKRTNERFRYHNVGHDASIKLIH